MTDVGDAIRTAAARKPAWDPFRAPDVARQAAALWAGAQVEWDQGAGERWLRVLDGKDVVAMLHVATPLLVVLESHAENVAKIAADDGVVVVRVADMAAADLRCDEEALAEAFPGWVRREPFDPEAFSADDLWWVTV